MNFTAPCTSPIAALSRLALAASVALGLAACSTPVLKSSMDVPDRFASSAVAQEEPELAWWEATGTRCYPT